MTRVARRGRAAALLVRAQGGVSGGRAASRRTTTAWTARFRASACGEVLQRIAAMEKKYGLRCANVFHAGDGNLHPLILFDANDADELAAHRGVRRRDARDVRRGRRHHHRRARRRRREDQPDVRAVRRRRARAVPRGQARVRPARPAQPGQGRADARALRRIRRHARARRQARRTRTCRAFESAQTSSEQIREAAAGRGERALRLRGGGTKDFYGNALRGDVLDTRGYAGIVDYEPTELVVTARCGTPLAELEAHACGERNRCWRSNRRTSAPARPSAAASRPGCRPAARRSAGALRDFVLGVKLIDGRGAGARFGGQVMKNVAGYDVSRLARRARSARSALIAEVSLKVLPQPPAEVHAAPRGAAGARARAA